jgi:hypothetical protein
MVEPDEIINNNVVNLQYLIAHGLNMISLGVLQHQKNQVAVTVLTRHFPHQSTHKHHHHALLQYHELVDLLKKKPFDTETVGLISLQRKAPSLLGQKQASD